MTIFDAMHRTYGKSSTHANDLDRLLQAQKLCCYQLKEISAVIIINHVKLIKYYGPQLRYGRVFNGGIDERIRLGAEQKVRSIRATGQVQQANLF